MKLPRAVCHRRAGLWGFVVPTMGVVTMFATMMSPVMGQGVDGEPRVESTYWVAAGRSPILGPDEHLDELIPAGLLGTPQRLVDMPPPKLGEVVVWTRAYLYVDQVITVEGEVVLTRNIGELCFLNFDRDFQGKFYLVVFDDVFGSLSEPAETYFLNKTVHATGQVVLHHGTPQIQIRKVGAIRVVD